MNNNLRTTMGRLNTRVLSTFLLSLLLLAPSLPTGCAPPSGDGPEGGRGRPRSVLLVSIDTLRADHLGAYGYEQPTSPFLDELSGEGTLFEAAISSAPWTLPAHASMLSGLHPSTHRAVDGSEGIAETVTLAAEIFQEAGFATGGFVASWFVSQRYGFQRGFDRFDDFQQTLQNNTKQKIPAVQVVDAAAGWLKENSDDPFFLFVHLYDAHFNYNPPAEHAALFDTGYPGQRPLYRKYSYYQDHPLDPALLAQEIAMYDGEIHYIDAQLRRLHGILEAQGLAEDVLVIVTSDHGEEFFERGSWGHAHTLYEEVIRVPLIVRGPGVQAGQRWNGQVRHVDLLPTLLDVFQLDPPGRLHGRSLWPILARAEDAAPAGGNAGLSQGIDDQRDDATAQDGVLDEAAVMDAAATVAVAAGNPLPRPAFMESSRFGSNMVGVRRDGWKVILDLKNRRQHLLNLAADPQEEDDLAGRDPERLQAMRRETLDAATLLVPDRWLLRWYADGEEPLSGRITTDGMIFLARSRGSGGHVKMEPGGGGLTYRLEPGGVLEMAVLPVDAVLTIEQPTSGERAIAFAIGRESKTVAGEPVEADSHQAELLTGIPTPLAPAAAFWLEQSRGSGSAVHLSEDEIRRLESLGYAMR